MLRARRFLQILAVVGALVVGTAALALVATQTVWFKEWLRGAIVRHAGDYINGELAIGRLDGNLFSGFGLNDVQLSMDGRPVVGADAIRIDYDALRLVRGDIVIDRIQLDRPVIRLERRGDSWNLAQLMKERESSESSGRPFAIRRLEVRGGRLDLEPGDVGGAAVNIPRRLQAIDVSMSLVSSPGELSAEIDRLAFRAEEPSLIVHELAGTVHKKRDGVTRGRVAIRTEQSSLRAEAMLRSFEGRPSELNVRASSGRVAFEEIGRIVPALQHYRLSPGFMATTSGPLNELRVIVDLSEPQVGRVTGDLTLDTIEPARSVAGQVTVSHFNVAPIVEGLRAGTPGTDHRPPAKPVPSDISGSVSIDLALPRERFPLSGTFALRAGPVRVAEYQASAIQARGRVDGQTVRLDAKAEAYGVSATAAGTVITGDQLALDLKGRALDVDLRKLPASLKAPKVDSDLDLEYSVRGRGSAFSGTATLSPSELAGARIADGTIAEFNVNGSDIRYGVKGSVSDLDLERIGNAFDIAALADERYRSRVNATFEVRGAAGGKEPLSIDAAGTLVDTSVFEARIPRMDFDAQIGNGDAHIKAVGDFSELDPSAVAKDARVHGRLTGSVDVEATLRDYAQGVTADSIDLAGSVTLADSTVDKVSIDSFVVEGQYAQRGGELKRLELTGADVQVSASGPISLAEAGSSDVVFHVETSSLERVGGIVGRTLKGAAVVDGRVTGNGESLDIRGDLTGSNVGDGENGALSLKSQFAVAIPDLTPARLAVKASSQATFLEIKGQKVNELAADTAFSESRLEFDARAQHGVRELAAGGTVIFHPDHQEIHLPRLALKTEQIEWRTPDKSDAAVRYFPDRIEIHELQLTSGDQQIRANGVLGTSSESLDVKIENMNIAEVDRLLLGDGRLAGRLQAEASITGPLKEPQVDAGFTVSQGGFGTFKYESLTGRIDYGGAGVMLDVKLQANPAEWLAAKGFAPLTLLRPNPEGVSGTHQEPAPGEAVDIQVTSSEIGLGLIQAFTPYVTKVTGALQTNIRVTGSGYDPHLEGNLTIRGGSFAVPELGTAYTGLDTEILLVPEGLTIREFRILDARGFPMTVGGTLAMHARSVGAVNISVDSSKFEVIDNKMADLKLNTNIQVTGDLRKPRVVGSIEVENGTVHLAELIERVTATAYSTRAAEIPGLEDAPPPRVNVPASDETSAKSSDEASAKPSAFDSIDLDLGLTVPGNLVLRGRDIRTGGAPVALGDINITVGGTIQVRKPPVEPLRLVGDVKTVRGTYTFQGRRFDIVRDGRIGFSGGEEIDPLLDLQARRVISGVETFVRVRGTMKRPELSFSSIPPLEEADILALIVFNQPLNELGEGEQVSLARRAGALAGGYLASGLTRSIGNALELDEFEIQAQDDTGSPSVRIGEQVGRNLFFMVRQAFGTEQTTELILEYQIADFLRLQATGAQGSAATERVQFRRVERAGLDLLFSFSY